MVSKVGKQSEYQLITKLRSKGFVVIHAPASGGGTKQPMPDMIVAKEGVPIHLIELKTCRSSKTIYISKEQINNLKILRKAFGISNYVIIVVKFIHLARGKHFVVRIEDLRETEKNFAVDFEKIKDNPELFTYLNCS